MCQDIQVMGFQKTEIPLGCKPLEHIKYYRFFSDQWTGSECAGNRSIQEQRQHRSCPLKNLSDRHPESVFINITGRDRL